MKHLITTVFWGFVLFSFLLPSCKSSCKSIVYQIDAKNVFCTTLERILLRSQLPERISLHLFFLYSPTTIQQYPYPYGQRSHEKQCLALPPYPYPVDHVHCYNISQYKIHDQNALPKAYTPGLTMSQCCYLVTVFYLISVFYFSLRY